MDTTTLAAAFRGSERLLIVSAAAICIWLGYRLFQSLPAVHSSEGSFELPSVKFTLSKIGPGAFFALFGALVLRQSVVHQLKTESWPTVNAKGDASPGIYQLTLGAGSGDPMAVRHVQTDIAVLNCLAQFAPAGIAHGEVEAALHKARVALLGPVWPPAWGAEAFAAIERGDISAGAITEIYRARHPSCPTSGVSSP
jgi:hypothetical protein